MSAPTLSVVMPSHNCERFVAATLACVLSQDHECFEVIVVDDGSSDASVEIIKQHADPRVTLIEKENGGAASARNRGLLEAKGKAILFLDADDLMGEGHLRALDMALGSSAENVAFGCWDRFRDDPAEATFPHRSYDHDGQALDWLLENWQSDAPMTQCGSFLIPRLLLDKVGGWDERLSLIDDFEFFARIMAAASQVRFAPDAKLYYRSNIEGSLSGQASRKAVESQFQAIDLAVSHVLQARNDDAARKACANQFAAFDFEHFPAHADLRDLAKAKVCDLGGADIEPVGPPNFHRLRSLVGWRMARHIQRMFERIRVAR